jgi:hypothetical protein
VLDPESRAGVRRSLYQASFVANQGSPLRMVTRAGFQAGGFRALSLAMVPSHRPPDRGSFFA